MFGSANSPEQQHNSWRRYDRSCALVDSTGAASPSQNANQLTVPDGYSDRHRRGESSDLFGNSARTSVQIMALSEQGRLTALDPRAMSGPSSGARRHRDDARRTRAVLSERRASSLIPTPFVSRVSISCRILVLPGAVGPAVGAGHRSIDLQVASTCRRPSPDRCWRLVA